MICVSIPNMAQSMQISHNGDTTIIRVENSTKYLILPIEEEKEEAQVLLDNGKPTDTWMDIRLAQDNVDYYVPFELNKGKTSVVKILNLKKDALTLRDGQMKLSNEWNVTNTDFYRPSYHHTPSYGWMNDPNGMFYKDGVYHLCFQYNPYGSKWGNMHWGHAISKDLIHWQEVAPTIARDPMGHIFSGSAVIDKMVRPAMVRMPSSPLTPLPVTKTDKYNVWLTVQMVATLSRNMKEIRYSLRLMV